MSKVIDQKVVEMQFDNRQFERNVATSMSTLERLKQSLKLPDASKSLDGINKAARNVNLSGIGNAVDTVQTKFSALQVAGVTALANITNSAVNAGKRIVKSLTVDPVTTGFNEYELKMGSIQTIMAGTGESLDRVNQKLNELNTYSDQTIYSFKDMTDNIGKFTNAGVKLDDAVDAIKGISNVAAISGASANEASRAMYNFSQALSAGYVQLMDWKSIELANMGTAEFRQQLIDAAVATGQLTKESEGLYRTIEGNEVTVESFRNTLQDKWLTSDVLIKTLKNYADGTTAIGKRATAAATEVKTFSMMMDTLKESVQSGWAQTWEIVVGDFEEAKTLFTNMSNAIGGFIDKISKARNDLLGDILTSPWEKLSKKISEAGYDMTEYEEKIREVAKAQGINSHKFDELIKKHDGLSGAVQAGVISSDMLKKALEKLGVSTDESGESIDDFVKDLKDIKRTLGKGSIGDDVKKLQTALDQLGHSVGECGIDGIIGPDTISAIKEFQREAGIAVDGIAGPETIAALEKTKTKIGDVDDSYSDLIDNMTKKGGRELVLESFTHILGEFKKILDVVGDAWNEAFGDVNMSDAIYGVIEKLHDLALELEITEDQATNFKNVFEGIFAAFQISNMLISATFTAGLKIAAAVLELFDTNLVEVAGHIATYITKLRDWIDEHTIFINIYDKIANVIVAFIEGIKSVIDAFKSLPQIKAIVSDIEEKILGFFGLINKDFEGTSIDKFCESLRVAFENVAKWIEGLKDSENLGKDIIDGLVNGLKAGVQRVVTTIMDLGKTLIETFCNVIQSHSPSVVFFTIGGFIIAGLVGGLVNGFPWVFETLKSFGQKCIEIISDISLPQVIGAALSVGMLLMVRKILNIVEMFAAPAKGFGKMMSGLGSMFEDIGDALNPKQSKWTIISKAILTAALAIATLTASVYVLGNMDADELVRAGIALTAMAGIVAGLMLFSNAMAKVDGFGDSFKSVLVISGSLLLLSLTMKKLSEVDLDNVPAALAAMAVMVLGVSAVLVAYGKLAKGESGRYIGRAGTLMLRMSAAFLLMAAVFKVIGMISDKDIIRGLAVVAAVELLFAAMATIVRGSGKNASKVGVMLLEMSAAMLIMIGVIKMASELDAETVLKGMGVLVLVEALFVATVAVSKKAGPNAAKAGAMIMMMSIAFVAIAFAIKQAADLDGGQVTKGLAIIAGVGLLFAALIAVSQKAGPNAVKAGVMLLAMSGALVILTGVIYLFSTMDPDGLGRALGIVTVLEVLFMGLIAVTKYAQNCVGTLIVLTVVISMLTVAVTALSFLDPDGLKNATAALTLLIHAFSLLVAATHFAKSSKGMNKSLIMMLGVVAVLAGIVAALTLIDPEGAVQSAAAVSLLMTSLAGALALMGVAGQISTTVSKHLLPMLGVVTGLAAILGIMSALDVEASISTAVALSVLLNAMATAMVILGYVGPQASANIGAMAMLGLIVAELVLVIAMMNALNVNPSIETAAGLSLLLLAMSGACAIVSLIPAAAATQGALGLAAFVGIIGGVIAALGALTLIPGFNELMSNGGKMLGDIGYAIGSFVGNIIGGFSAGAMSGLPEIGNHLSGFMTNAQPFIDGVAKIDDKMMAGVKTLAEAILILTAADMVSGISSLLGMGDASLETFGAQLTGLSTHMNTFVNNLGTFTEEQVTTVTCAADAIKTMAQAAASIPNDGGWIEAIVGGNNLDTFGDKLPTMALKLHDFVTILSGFGSDQVEIVSNAANAIGVMADAAGKIPEDGGWLEAIVGGNSLETFGTKLPLLATNLSAFVTNLGDFGKEKIESVRNAAEAIKVMAQASTEIPNEGGWMDAIVGGNSVDTFGAKLADLGNSIRAFVENISGIDLGKVDSAAEVLRAIVELVNIDFSIATEGINTFCTRMQTLASDAVDKFAEKLSSYDSKTKVKSAITELVLAAANKAKSSSVYTMFKNAGKYLVEGFIAGINSKRGDAIAAARQMASAAAAAAEAELKIASPSKVFYRIGEFTGLGFVNALGAYESVSYDAGSNVAVAARDGLRDAIGKIQNIVDADMDVHPIISPVLDLTNIQNGVDRMGGLFGQPAVALSGIGATGNNLNSIVAQMQNQSNPNADVVSAIANLRSDFGNLVSAIGNMHIRMDSGTVVGELIGKIDNSLGAIATHKGRGN